MALRVSKEEAIQRGWIKPEPPPPAPDPDLTTRSHIRDPNPPRPPSPIVVYLPGKSLKRGPMLSAGFMCALSAILGWLLGFLMGLMFPG